MCLDICPRIECPTINWSCTMYAINNRDTTMYMNAYYIYSIVQDDRLISLLKFWTLISLLTNNNHLTLGNMRGIKNLLYQLHHTCIKECLWQFWDGENIGWTWLEYYIVYFVLGWGTGVDLGGLGVNIWTWTWQCMVGLLFEWGNKIKFHRFCISVIVNM